MILALLYNLVNDVPVGLCSVTFGSVASENTFVL